MTGIRSKLQGLTIIAVALGTVSASVPQAGAGEETKRVLEKFNNDWPEDRIPYRSTEDSTTWKTYALSMKSLVALGNSASEDLIEACDHPNFQVRALAARVLGYLKAETAVPKLIKSLEDPQAPVALHAADALGQIQDPRGLAALKTAQAEEKRGDVLLHIAKSLERKVPLEDDVTDQILRINEHSIDSAQVGRPAPDFTLKDSSGKPWKLSDFKGRKTVVLAFIYGDG